MSYRTVPIGIDEMIEICREYAQLGGAIQDQVDAWLEGDRVGDDTIAAGAVPYIKGFLKALKYSEVVDADWTELGIDD